MVAIRWKADADVVTAIRAVSQAATTSGDAVREQIGLHGVPLTRDCLLRVMGATGGPLPRGPPIAEEQRAVALRAYDDEAARHYLFQLTELGPDATVEDGALLIARALYGLRADVGWVPAVLDSLAAEARRRMLQRGVSGGVAALEVINHLLFGEVQATGGAPAAPGLGAGVAVPRLGGIGLKGNRLQYMDPHNSMLDFVLSRGLGIPITLCIVHAAVARRAGLHVALLNTPGAVLGRFGAYGTSEARYIDGFSGSMVIGEVMESLEVPEMLAVEMRPPAAWCRMMRNLRAAPAPTVPPPPDDEGGGLLAWKARRFSPVISCVTHRLLSR